MFPTTIDHRKGGLGSLAACLLLATACMPPVAAHAAPAAQAASRQSYDIPAGPLAIALNRFSETSNIQLVYDASLTRNLPSPGLRGTMTPVDALSRLLAGSGLSYKFTDGRTVVLARASAAITLGPVRVGGTTRQSPTGPGVGYVAENTMAGTKTDTSIMEIPNSIYVITKQEMIDQQAQNVQEALRYSPGIYAEPNGTYGNNAPSTGNGSTSIEQRGFSSSQFVDGLLTNSGSAGETQFLERVEVVNGPTSVMYGQTTPGGMIAMSLKKPTDTPLHQVSLGFGNWGRYEATFDLSDKITKSGNVRYRIAAIGVTQGTQTHYIDYHRVGVLPSITWDIDRKTSLTVLGEYMYTPGDGANYSGQFPENGSLFPGPQGRIPRSTFYGARNYNETGATDAMFEYLFRHTFNKYIEFNQTFRWEKSDTIGNELSDSSVISSTQRELGEWGPGIDRNKTIALDSRLTGKIDTGPLSHTWVVGSDFREYSYDNIQTIDNTSDIVTDIYNPHTVYTPCLDIYSEKCMNSKSIFISDRFQEGVYFQDQMKWKGLSVLLGGREDWVNYDKSKSHTLSNQNATHTITDKPSTATPQPQHAFTWRAGLVYQFRFGLAPYFSYSTSFIPQSSTNFQGQPFAPLTGQQLEAGLKYKVPNKDILLTAAAFHIDENHYLITDPAHSGYSEDAGRVRSQGFEVAANANVTRDLRLVASYTYTDMRFAKTNKTAQRYDPYAQSYYGNALSQQGMSVPYVPRNMFSFFTNYRLPSQAMKGFEVNFGARYVGFTYSDSVESYKTRPYVLFDAGASYDFGQRFSLLKGLKAQLAMSNLANTYYVTSCSSDFGCYVGQGRRVYGNLTYNW
ncbi:ligand-gated channel [Gluconacetobacter liquefaciens]|uniref:Iron complex outermembrane receptor protein n=1 Tax=Gluconacetobacter liquefaciens TaxID=89584 RepID=A0A370GAA0_GLULI|nr:TonB-dependent siderophore receptor [Gluconacetobacter liquefaciens]MBB2185332.1 TonB-dependent siderophore receptor [Gluconacetobacter liquefaciens]RDI40772.1 iron complex outermembrane receptor protein [Gluconacetobacter liquefaciens]GBR01719.1 ferric iron siderophore receptor [Gluconacetobacter liquefaciens NRIC 0522]GEB37770.1 ligand-gated channel [Gluconacetobacter liquefaciens]